jgi:hypothetical protein
LVFFSVANACRAYHASHSIAPGMTAAEIIEAALSRSKTE